MARTATTDAEDQGAAQYKRVSLSFTVPEHAAVEAWNHLIDTIERFAKRNRVDVSDLDVNSAPTGKGARLGISR